MKQSYPPMKDLPRWANTEREASNLRAMAAELDREGPAATWPVSASWLRFVADKIDKR